MKKATFDPKGVTATLINRVYRTGIGLIITINKVQNKSVSIDHSVIEDMETDYLLANIELESMLKSQLAQKNDGSWGLFVDSVNKLSSAEKQIFMGVVRSVKQTAENILSDNPNPFATSSFELPPYILPYFPTVPVGIDPNFWNKVIDDAETLEVSREGFVQGVGEIAGAIAAAGQIAAGTVAAPFAATIAAGCAAFHGGVQIGNAINTYFGWEEWK